MNPAPSLIVFTVLSGAGLGLIAWIGLGLDGGPAFAWAAPLVALGLTAIGGLASVAHLARPDRAWRAFSQWRSSWLSREAVLLAVTVALFAVYAGLWALAGLRFWGLGWLVALLALATVYATAMIYAQLRTVPRWSVPPTPELFIALALVGGYLAAGALAGLTGGAAHSGRVVLALAVAAGIAIWWQTQATGARRSVQGTTLATATGLEGARIRAFEPPHTGSNYLLDEMAFRVGRRRAWQLRWLGAALGFLVPGAVALLSLALGDGVLVVALIAHLAGVMALRWLFFAEAEHVQALYYGVGSR
ncbi:MAG: dimethyl sulfoxide reductase anchor subunit family protein [Paracoccaceae bacterium]